MAKRGRTRRFTPEFIAQAVQLVQESGRDLKDVAKQLGIGHSTLCRWCLRAEGKTAGEAHKIVDVAETPEEELKRLRKRVRELELEKEILKKATAFFAKENL